MQNKGNLEKRRLLKLNFDDELRDLQNGEMRYALNCRVGNSDNNNQGDIENVKGNVLVSFILPSGLNKCIGAKEDLVKKRIFYFVYNSLGFHGIYEYSEPNNAITTILQNTSTDKPLNFDPNYLITGINIIEDLLYWTDDLNEPMKIDVEKAKTAGYPSPFLVDYIYAIKPPQPCEPTVNYASDTSKNTNFLKQKLFQFKARYVYDNGEKSVPSPISIVALPTGGCSLQTSTDNNIVVTVETGNAIVKEIEIFAREVSDITLSQATDFYTITILNKAELGIADNTTYQYAFYNDKNYIALDTVRSNQLQDFVPIKAKAQELVDGNRLVYGNIEEGFDPVDVKAKLQINYEDNVIIDSIDITGRLFIGNPFVIGNAYAHCQPIHNNGGPGIGAQPCFGGFDQPSQFNFTGDPVFVDDVISKYNQKIPLGGFVVYLAGTNYSDVTVQNNNTSYGITTYGTTNVYDSITKGARKKIKNAIEAFNQGTAQVYNTFTIKNVTQGRYILRVASHLTDPTSYNSGSLDYQKTSTYTTIVGGFAGTEVIIDYKIINGAPVVTVNNVPVSLNITATSKTLDLSNVQSPYKGQTWVLDLTNPTYNLSPGLPDYSPSAIVDGYVCDKDNGPATGYAILNDTRIPLAKVKFVNNVSPTAFNIVGSSSYVSNAWQKKESYTDHNGFFFFARNVFDNPTQATIYTGSNLALLNPGNGFYEGNTLQTSFDFTSGIQSYIIQNVTTTSVQQFGRTIIKGTIVDINNALISNINVQLSGGGSSKTSVNGEFFIYAYGSQLPPLNGFSRSGTLCYSLGLANCYGVFTQNGTNISFSLGPNPLYNAVVPNGTYVDFTSPVTSVSFQSNASVSLKRGATYEYGIVYYDHGLRNGTTQTKDYFYNETNKNYGLKVYVPFYTDTFPGTTTIVDSGKPVINWAIANTPPDWATHYQWVRTKRGSISNYIQWTLSSVQYIDDIGNNTSFAAATQVKINLTSIVGLTSQGYKQRNKNSILDYQFVEGDRVRFIKKYNDQFFPQYYDVEIKGIDSAINNLVLIIPNNTGSTQLDPGDLIEIYRPVFGNISVEEDIFYEIGECYEIGDVGLPTRYHKQGKNTPTTITIPNYKWQNQDTSKTWQYTSVFGTVLGLFNLLTLQGTKPHNYNIGDQIIIEQSNGYTKGLSTLTSVWSIPNTNQVVVFIPYVSSFAPYQSGTVYYPATGIFSTGDTYYKTRNIPYNSATTYQTTSPNTEWWYIEDQNFSDFFTSSYYSIGRPNKVDKQFKKIRRPTTVYYSGQFIPETSINDLNNILDTSFETYERAYGSIQRLYNIDRMLDCYQELKVGRIPISQQIWRDAGGSPVAALSNNILNPIQYYSGEFGIAKNPESLSVYGYRRYFLDANRGVFLRLSTDGITPISEHNFKAHNFFTDECKALTELGLPFHVYTVYDQKFTEVVVAFEDVFDDVEQKYTGKTLSFNEDENTWASFYSYKPDYMVSNDTDIITFKNGELWKHNESTVYNNFYGFQYGSEVHFPVNGQPSKEKVFQAISFEDANPWDVIAECPNGMLTTLSSSDFELLRNMRYAYFKNDINTPNTWNQAGFNAIIDGQKMQDYVMLVKLISNNKFFQKLYAVNVLWTPVERSNK